MRGDFSRFTFNPDQNYISVLKQQGRVELDADWNEQGDIWIENARQFTADLLGPFAVPLSPNEIRPDNLQALAVSGYSPKPGGVFDFAIGRGLAYIGGYQFRLPKDITFMSQPDFPEPDLPASGGDILIFIEVWKRSVNYIDDDLIREPALGGPDTCLRTKLVGQVKAISCESINSPPEAGEFLARQFSPGNILLTMKIDESAHQIPMTFGEIDPGGGLIPGNLHYRIELHRGISDSGGQADGMKWSDDNGAVVIRALKAADRRNILIEEAEPVTGESLKPGDWVEVSNLITELHRQGSQMTRIVAVESAAGGALVTLEREIHPILTRRKNGDKTGLDKGLLPRLRRWSGYEPLLAMKNVYDLGRGVKAIFNTSERKAIFDPSDYWTFAIRDREYNKLRAPLKAAANGIAKYRHPLAIIKRGDNLQVGDIIDCRRFFKPLAEFNIS